MEETIQEMGPCESCGKEINFAEAWRVDEKYYCQNCFDKMNI